MAPEPLPIDGLLPQLTAALGPAGATVLLQAPPGAGKTTRVPLAIQPSLEGRVWMLEPRRIAARTAAQRLAAEHGEAVGGLIGYSVRLESRTSAATRVEVLTEGLFLRRLQADPGLDGVDCLIFDEFHERNADADLALALVRQVRDLLRPDLRLVLMSATLALESLAQQLPGAVVLRSEGRGFPVTVSHQPARGNERLEQQVVRALEEHWLDQRRPGETVLVFLPGRREIDRCAGAIHAAAWSDALEVTPLHGNLDLAEQTRAIAPARSEAGKVVLATSIAESSLTIAGVAVVVDSGLSRRNRFDPARGLSGLVTGPASQASAEQRAGRAGRLAPGRCVRLWSPAEQQRRPAQTPPELLEADPLPLALQLARWGDPLGTELQWIDPPPQAGVLEARRLLQLLGALEAGGQLSRHGEAMAALGLHPRLAHLLLMGHRRGLTELASELAVLLSERDPLPREAVGCDLGHRLDWLRRQSPGHPIQQLRRQWRQQLRAVADEPAPAAGNADAAAGDEGLNAALLVSEAFPERLALARDGQGGRFLLRNGRGAILHPDDPLRDQQALAAAALDGEGRDARILLALPLPVQALRQLALEQGLEETGAVWEEQAGRVRCERLLRLGALVLERRPWPEAEPDQVRIALLGGLRRLGLEALPWTATCRQLQQRLSLAHAHCGAPWPDRRDEILAADLDAWLGPHLTGVASLTELRQLDLGEALWGDLDWPRRQELERLLPSRLPVPSGRSVAVDYSSGVPVLAVKLQELFGCRQTPAVLGGALPVTLHLLTPAGRPAAITQDLEGFWAEGYRQVRRELRGRYPKHPWPEDGASAAPTAGTRSRAAQANR
ncbi:ATP-dependent helicase HrpB [Cyanobium sp. CH-040]|uniref:ATP-dependent helicase HrpB n=1 Tax=Cyanobium sp. CH-040 TaxID=2823708 RepID=UPI0020CDE03C|nr:ATP-dependent helicase HrpB [Cyanobium sp. CH-040]MCP9927228.1 ATP-dependent helicase HrpB [Cyanobium sp. CH-040]